MLMCSSFYNIRVINEDTYTKLLLFLSNTISRPTTLYTYIRIYIIYPSSPSKTSTDGAKKTQPVNGLEKSSNRSCKPSGCPTNIRYSIFSITHNRLVYPLK